MSDELAMLDGAIAPAGETVLPVTDQGFIRGDGAFEVVRVYDGTAFLMDEHLDRIERSAANLRLDGAVPREQLLAETAELLERRGRRTAVRRRAAGDPDPRRSPAADHRAAAPSCPSACAWPPSPTRPRACWTA